MRALVLLLVLAAITGGCTLAPPQTTPHPPTPTGGPTLTTPLDLDPSKPVIALAPLYDGLARPVLVTHAGDGSGRHFVVEQAGRILVSTDKGLSELLDLTPRISSGGERGLLGLAFGDDGRIYVSFTDTQGDSRVVRFSADLAAEEELLRVEQPYPNHNGGHLAFGPDGYLYFGLGDGGSGGDPHGNGQDPRALLGSLLRLDVSGASGYAIPSDNPFADAGGAPEVWAKGLRNPWRFSFDRVTGDLYLGDVGQNEWEEIDYLPAGSTGGANFGWNVYEGSHLFRGAAGPQGMIGPIAEYGHSEGGCSVTGGHVYRGAQIPQLWGTYLFADYCDGKVRALRHVDGEWRAAVVLESRAAVSSFGEDEAGELFLLDHGGRVLRIVDGGGPLPTSLQG